MRIVHIRKFYLCVLYIFENFIIDDYKYQCMKTILKGENKVKKTQRHGFERTNIFFMGKKKRLDSLRNCVFAQAYCINLEFSPVYIQRY